nr:hypothetical protein DCAR_007733 [Ipomoea batatas]
MWCDLILLDQFRLKEGDRWDSTLDLYGGRREHIAIDCFAYLFYYGRLGDIKGRPLSLFGNDVILSSFVEPWG